MNAWERGFKEGTSDNRIANLEAVESTKGPGTGGSEELSVSYLRYNWLDY